MTIEIIGYAAAFLTTGSFVPQAVKVWREDDTAAISLGMYSLFVVGVALWLVYGFSIGSMPMNVANSITLCLACSILYKKIQHLRAGKP